eukprot:6031099-Amphidinium_carterae.1
MHRGTQSLTALLCFEDATGIEEALKEEQQGYADVPTERVDRVSLIFVFRAPSSASVSSFPHFAWDLRTCCFAQTMVSRDSVALVILWAGRQKPPAARANGPLTKVTRLLPLRERERVGVCLESVQLKSPSTTSCSLEGA